MPDKTEKIVDQALRVFQSAVTARASRDESLGQLLPVADDDETTLAYRQKGVLDGDEAAVPQLRKLKGSFHWAYELAHRKPYGSKQLDLPEESLRAEASDFAKTALDLEREAVFCELRTLGQKVEELSLDTLEATVLGLKGVCRFIGGSEYARQAEKAGILVDVRHYPRGNPPGTVGMVIRMDEGPVVRRLAGGLTLGWTRLSSEQVELELSERFFLDRPDRVCWFESVAPPAPPAATATGAQATQEP